ncbi:hypothetical protein Poly21_05770 [Allorhodopirellula heiligendammensis]|uniref:Uncharacterized protein n=1 Tax=Allorhodopirellula heiligendammensis TaxID=2714739 RepID=A0A5C6C2W0_9BACT|nr:hypothetical protein Poly21_05770 [Allorhodopirellula heiligendammensis]
MGRHVGRWQLRAASAYTETASLVTLTFIGTNAALDHDRLESTPQASSPKTADNTIVIGNHQAVTDNGGCSHEFATRLKRPLFRAVCNRQS